MKDAIEIKWKEHSYLLRIGTIFLMDKPLPEIRNYNFEGKVVVQDTTAFAGMVIDVAASANQIWLYCAQYSRDRAVINSFASHGVTLMFDRGDKWLITPSMIADVLKLKQVKLIDDNGNHVRDLAPDGYCNFRITPEIIKKALPMIGSDERILDFFEWNTRVFRTMLNINGMVQDQRADQALSKRQFPIIEDVVNFQKQMAAMKASEKFIPKKKALPKSKMAAAYASTGSGSATHAYPQRARSVPPTTRDSSLTLNNLPYVKSTARSAMSSAGRYTTGYVGGFNALDIHPDIFVGTDRINNKAEVFLERREDMQAAEFLLSYGTILCVAGQPSFIIIDPHWNLTEELDQMSYVIPIFTDEQIIKAKGLPIDTVEDSSSPIYHLIGLKWPSRLRQSQQMPASLPNRNNLPTILPTIMLKSNRFLLENNNTAITIDISDLGDSQIAGLKKPGTNVVWLDEYNEGRHIFSYLVVDYRFLARSHVPHYKVFFSIFGDLTAEEAYYIDYNSANKTEFIRYLEETTAEAEVDRLLSTAPEYEHEEEVAIPSEPTLESMPMPASTPFRDIIPMEHNDVDFVFCDSVMSISFAVKTIVMDFDSMPDRAANKITAVGTTFKIKNRTRGNIMGKWQVVGGNWQANSVIYNWRMMLQSTRRNPDINGAVIYLLELETERATETEHSRESSVRPIMARTGQVERTAPEPRFVEAGVEGNITISGSAGYTTRLDNQPISPAYASWGEAPPEAARAWLADQPMATSFWSQDPPAPAPVYNYMLSTNNIIYVTINGIDYEIDVNDFRIIAIISPNTIRVRYKMAGSLNSEYCPPMLVIRNSEGWVAMSNNINLIELAPDLVEFLNVFYDIPITAEEPPRPSIRRID